MFNIGLGKRLKHLLFARKRCDPERLIFWHCERANGIGRVAQEENIIFLDGPNVYFVRYLTFSVGLIIRSLYINKILSFTWTRYSLSRFV